MKIDCIIRLIINVARVTIAYLKDRIELCHHVRILITLVMETLKRHILNNIISNENRSVNVVSAREKLEHSVGLEVPAEGETWLARTGVGGLSGSDIRSTRDPIQ